MTRAVAAFILLVSFLAAAEPVGPVTLEHTEHRTLRSDVIGHTYDLFVSLPADYATSGRAYPVLYVLDGWHFPLMAFFQNNNQYSRRIPPVIIVNIGHGRGADTMRLRARDFTPTPLADVPGSGGAPAFLDFLEREIIPYVDRTYRTDPTDRGLLGHSLGGLFALHALVERPGLFQRIVAASPVADYDQRRLFDAARAKLATLPRPVRLDLSAAADEHDVAGSDITTATQDFARLLDELKPAGLAHRLTIYPGENHNSVRFAAFPPGLYWVYRP